MERYNNILCVTYEDLENIMPYKTINTLVTRRKCNVIRSGYGRDVYALIRYSSLPDKYQHKFERIVGHPAEILRKREACKALEIADMAEAVRYFSSYSYIKNGQQISLTDELRVQYIKNATALDMLCRYEDEKNVMRKKSGNTAQRKKIDGRVLESVFDAVMTHCEELRAAYEHTLPHDATTLRRKMREYRLKGFEAVVSGKLGNTNTLKVLPEGLKYLVALKRDVRRWDLATIRSLYNGRAAQEGWDIIKDDSTLGKWYNRPDIIRLTADVVEGEQAAHQRLDRKHSTELPTLRDTIWYGDGTKLNLYYRDDSGKVCTINVYEVMDAATEVLLGYHISQSENYDAQYHAYRMAIETSGEKPLEIVYDNQGGHKKLARTEFFSRIAKTHRPTAPYNGSSKTIENAFYRFQDQVLRHLFNFTGQNITTKGKRGKINVEFIEANKHLLPTYDELCQQYADARGQWNEAKHPKAESSRMELYKRMKNPACQQVTEYDMMDMFWFTTERPSTYTANGISISVGDRTQTYEVYATVGLPDIDWSSRNIGSKFYIQYDPDDMRRVRLLTGEKDPAQRRFVKMAEPKMTIHRSRFEQTEEERRFIIQMREAIFQERVNRLAEARAIEFECGTAPEQQGLVSPEPKGLPKEYKEQLRKRVEKQRQRAAVEGLGTYTKSISLEDYISIKEDETDTTERFYNKL